jgi:hypothetical protein
VRRGRKLAAQTENSKEALIVCFREVELGIAIPSPDGTNVEAELLNWEVFVEFDLTRGEGYRDTHFLHIER